MKSRKGWSCVPSVFQHVSDSRKWGADVQVIRPLGRSVKAVVLKSKRWFKTEALAWAWIRRAVPRLDALLLRARLGGKP